MIINLMIGRVTSPLDAVLRIYRLRPDELDRFSDYQVIAANLIRTPRQRAFRQVFAQPVGQQHQ